FLSTYIHLPHLHSFPTRRSSDLIELQRSTLGLRQTTHIRVSAIPIDHIMGLTALLRDFERACKLADQKRGIIDLHRRQSGRQIELDGRYAFELEARAGAAHLHAKRVTADRKRCAVLRPPGVAFTLAPTG